MLRRLALVALALLVQSAACSQTALSVPPDSPRWDLQGEAKVAEYQGRKCLALNGGVALLKDFEMREASSMSTSPLQAAAGASSAAWWTRILTGL
jgi:hypothetical protein